MTDVGQPSLTRFDILMQAEREVEVIVIAARRIAWRV